MNNTNNQPNNQPDNQPDKDIEPFVALATTEARQDWLRKYQPQKNLDFITDLREEANRRGRDNPTTALPIAEAVTDAADFWADRQTEAIALHIEANIRRLLADHKRALALYQQAAARYGSLGMELESARVAVGQLATMQYLGLYEEALQMAEWVEAVFRSEGDQLTLGKMVMNRGNIFARLDRYQEARQCYTQAHTIFTEIGHERNVAMLEANMANILTNLNDFRQAEKMYQQARTYFEKEGMSSALAQIDQNLAYLYFAQGDYQQALRIFKQAREIFADQNDGVRVAYVDLDRSETYLTLNLWTEALNLSQAARSSFEGANMPFETARLWLIEAAALAHLEAQTLPDHALSEAQKLFTQHGNTIWLAVTDLYRATFNTRWGNLDAAYESANRAKEVFQTAGLQNRVAQCVIILGEIALLQKDASVALTCFSHGLDLFENQDLPAISFACHFGLGRAKGLQGEVLEARHHYRQAVSDIERLQAAIGAEDYKIAFFSDKLEVYQALIMLCLGLDTPAAAWEAFETAERAKSRSLLDALAGDNLGVASSPVEAHLVEKLETLKSELNWYYNRLNQPQINDEGISPEHLRYLTEAITQREKGLTELLNQWRSPDLARAPRNPIWTVTVPQIQAVLPDDMLLLEFYTTSDQIIVFGLSAQAVWTEILPVSQGQLSNWLGQLQFQMNKFSYGPAYRQRHAANLKQATQGILHHLYQAIIAPIMPNLSASTLVIVPHNLLHYIPFQALFDGQDYLLDHKTISYAPSATILQRVLTAPHVKPTEPPLILGVPDETIPHVTAEVEAIGNLFQQAQVQVGEQATIDKLMTNHSHLPFLHLSTHATFRADNPLFSALKLSDGWVNVNDIYNMQSSAPLVTLSACETGGTQVAGGDELVGLCRGFFSAGAKSMVVSLWSVEDQSTARLMTNFYQNLKAGQGVNVALQAAQQAIKADQEHPYYWSPFILTGDPLQKVLINDDLLYSSKGEKF